MMILMLGAAAVVLVAAAELDACAEPPLKRTRRTKEDAEHRYEVERRRRIQIFQNGKEQHI